jgi:hypothetical protein
MMRQDERGYQRGAARGSPDQTWWLSLVPLGAGLGNLDPPQQRLPDGGVGVALLPRRAVEGQQVALTGGDGLTADVGGQRFPFVAETAVPWKPVKMT